MVYIVGEFVAVDGGAGCGDAKRDVPEGDCKKIAHKLGFDCSKEYTVYNKKHLPHGCFVGHEHTDWHYCYYNKHAGTTNPGFKSICRKGKCSFLFVCVI